MTRRARGRAQLYVAGLRKLALAERPTPDEARELRRRRLADGTYPVPRPDDAARRLAFRHVDPRLA